MQVVYVATVGTAVLSALVLAFSTGKGGDAIGLAAITLVAIFGYFLPAIVAGHRRHPSGGGILVVNLFFGWTLVGWVVALAWALSGASSAEPPKSTRQPIGDTRPCPYCAEEIKLAAKLCKHCGRETAPQEVPLPQTGR